MTKEKNSKNKAKHTKLMSQKKAKLKEIEASRKLRLKEILNKSKGE